MRQKLSESLDIASGISCELSNKQLKCKKDSIEVAIPVDVPCMNVLIKDNKVFFECEKGNKRDYKTIKSFIAHLKKTFLGLQNEYVYKLESCNVHFPMTLKVEGDKLIIIRKEEKVQAQ